jgi:hypothetical protein
MNVDDLIQLLILGGAGLAWLLGSGRAKKRPPEPRPRRQPPPPTRPVQRYQPPTTVVVRPAVSQRQPAATMAEEIYRILSGEAEQRERDATLEIQETDEGTLEIMRDETAPSRATLEEIHEAEAYSLETLEPAGEESHKRFHEKYARPSQPDQPAKPAEPVRRLRLTANARSLRDAMIWREILGPPKAFTD